VATPPESGARVTTHEESIRPPNQTFAKYYGVSAEHLRAGLEADELFAIRPGLSLSAIRELLTRNGELAEVYPDLADLTSMHNRKVGAGLEFRALLENGVEWLESY
jgi:hypothetical protein